MPQSGSGIAMTSLPPRRKSWLRPAILCGATLLGLALLIWWMPQVKDVFHLDTDGGISMTWNAQALLTLAVLVAGAGSLVWGMIAVLKWEE